MLNIEVAGEYKLTSDGLQIVVKRKHTIDPTQGPTYKPGDDTTIREEWKPWKYCGKVEHALELIAQQRIFETEAPTLADLLNEITSFRCEIRRVWQSVDKLEG